MEAADQRGGLHGEPNSLHGEGYGGHLPGDEEN